MSVKLKQLYLQGNESAANEAIAEVFGSPHYHQGNEVNILVGHVVKTLGPSAWWSRYVRLSVGVVRVRDGKVEFDRQYDSLLIGVIVLLAVWNLYWIVVMGRRLLGLR
jgi:hypothetical protein